MMEDEYTQVSIIYENQLICSCIMKHSIMAEFSTEACRGMKDWKKDMLKYIWTC